MEQYINYMVADITFFQVNDYNNVYDLDLRYYSVFDMVANDNDMRGTL